MTGSNRAKNLLLILPSPMGDAILATPALRHLRQNLPDCRITAWANPVVAEILAGNPAIDAWKVLPKTHGMAATACDLKAQHFDAAILLTNSFRSALTVFLAGIPRRIGYHRDGRGWLLTRPIPPFRLGPRYAPISMLDYYCWLADQALNDLATGPATLRQESDCRLELYASSADDAKAEELLQRWQISARRPLVIMVPGGAFGGSKWWPVERFAQLADRLRESHACQVIVSGAPNRVEMELTRRLVGAARHPIYNLAEEKASLGVLKALVRRCQLMVSNDTGPCHIAAAFNVPLVTLFGPTDPRWTATGYDREQRLRRDVDCGPCQKQLCPRDHRCLNQIHVDEVYAAAVRFLAGPAPASQQRADEILTGTYYQPFDEHFTPLRDGSGLVHRDYHPLLRRHKLGTLDEVFAYARAQLLDKPGLGHRRRLRLDLPRPDGLPLVLYLKRFEPPWGQALRQSIRRLSRIASGPYEFAVCMALAEKGIATARPVACGAEYAIGGEKRSFVIFEELPHADALERLLPQSSENKYGYALLQHHRRLIMELAALVRSLHQAGYYHRDLYLSHIFLCRDRHGRERLSLIDLQRVFQPKWCRRRWQIKDLAQLYYSAQAYFSASDMLRFLRQYLLCPRLNRQQKNLARAVLAKARRISRHDRNRQLRLNKGQL